MHLPSGLSAEKPFSKSGGMAGSQGGYQACWIMAGGQWPVIAEKLLLTTED
jgi:hypothetical protein